MSEKKKKDHVSLLRLVRRMYRYAGRYLPLFILMVFIMTILAGVDRGRVYLIKPMMEGGLGGEDYLVFGMMPVAIMFAVSAVTLVGVSLFTRPPEKELVDRFFRQP